MISIRKLRKSFHAQQGVVNALKEIDLEVAEGDFCVLLGPERLRQDNHSHDASPVWRGLTAEKSKSVDAWSILPRRGSLFPPRSARSAWFFNPMRFGRT